jgi:hypothetical protein
MNWLRRCLDYPHLAATLALFLVLAGGTAYGLAGTNTVDSGDIINGEVKSQDVAKDTTAAALKGSNISNANGGTLTGKDISESTLAFGKTILCDDTTPAAGGPEVCATATVRGFDYTLSCEETAGPVVTARVSITHPTAPSFSVHSDALGGVVDGTGLTGQQQLAVVGPSSGSHYQSGDYAASTAPIGGAPDGVSVFGQVIAGTNLAGGECKLGVTAHG